LGFRVVQVNLARTTDQVDEDAGFCFCGKVQPRASGVRFRPVVRQQAIRAEQARQRRAADASGTTSQKTSAFSK
jgi:hypothetical protein